MALHDYPWVEGTKYVFINYKAKIYTEACYFAVNIERNSTKKERNCNKGLMKQVNFLTLLQREVLLTSGGLEKIRKLISGGGAFIWYVLFEWPQREMTDSISRIFIMLKNPTKFRTGRPVSRAD